jgi:hypothetical protein
MPWQYTINGKPSEQAPTGEEMLATLKSGHPRIIINENTVDNVQKILNTDPHAPKWYEHLKNETDAILTEAPSHYEIPDGRRLLSVSRRVKERVRALMFIHLMEGGDQYVDRTWAEIEAACNFQDWNPSHFLDTAEMTYAVAMSLDWLNDQWSDAQKETMQNAIIEKGLKPGLDVYNGNVGHRWDLNQNNWNQVCNSGLSIGALVIADQDPDLAKTILHHAIQSIPLPMKHYAPDGAGTEGVTYWDYGSRYNLLYLSSLETALGTDFGLSKIPGFKESGQYQMYISGATRQSYNFSDCGLRRMGTPMHFWMGKKYKKPEYSWFRYSELAGGHQDAKVLDFLWFDEKGKDFDPKTLKLDKHFREANVASMRSSWTDPNALSVGIQGGNNANLGMHRHVDLGSFILEALGERWIIDSGNDSETYQRHRNKREKWEFYRIRAEGHNVPLFNPNENAGQKLDATAPIISFRSSKENATAVVDLSDAYSETSHRVIRTFEMQERQRVVVTDEIENNDHTDFWWFLHTHADIEIDFTFRKAILTQNGKKLQIKIEDGPSLAEFDVMDAEPLSTSPKPDQADNSNIKKLVVHIGDILRFSLVVSFTPITE